MDEAQRQHALELAEQADLLVIGAGAAVHRRRLGGLKKRAWTCRAQCGFCGF